MRPYSYYSLKPKLFQLNLCTVGLQLKSINAVDLDEEYLDVTVFMTFEWIDPNLAWIVKEKELTLKKSEDPPVSKFYRIQEHDPEGE